MGSFTFEGEASNVRAARLEVTAALKAAGVESSGIAVLLTSELVSNAVEHAGTTFDLVIEIDDRVVRIEIHDGRAIEQAFRDLVDSPPGIVDHVAPSGRGLALVGMHARLGLIDKGADGKAVWFELPLADA